MPLASRDSGPVADTATVPLLFGMVMVLPVPDGVAKLRVLVTPALVLLSVVLEPCKIKLCVVEPMVEAMVGLIVATLRLPPIATVVPLSVIIESPTALLLVNLAIVLAVPPGVVTLPPTPTQLPAVVQTS